MVIDSATWPYAHAAAAGCVYWAVSAGPWIVQVLQFITSLCSICIGFVYLDRLFLLVLLGFARLSGRTDPRKLYKFQPLNNQDSSAFPNVLVQLPMYNEKEVYKISIGAVGRISWPKDRLHVQVLDDSDDAATQELIKKECEVWRGRGLNIKRVTRANREGYKAGNLANGLAEADAKECQFVAVFDADFEPRPDFLERSIPFLVHNPQVGAVIGCWAFRNENESLIAKFQALYYANYFNLQLPVGSTFFGFANFYGSGGVWRIAAIQDVGGWKSRVLVEDVDLSISAALKGWKSVCLEDLASKSELPIAYEGFRLQCNRLANGVMNVVRLHFLDILKSKVLRFGTKYFIAVSLFNFILYENFAGFFYSCIVVPVVLLFPEIQVFNIILVAPFVIHTLRILITTPRQVHLTVVWAIFENVRQVIRAKDSTLAFLGITTKWVVTKKGKGGQSSKQESRSAGIFILELLIGLWMFVCASLATSSAYWPLRLYLFLQALAYFICGLHVRV